MNDPIVAFIDVVDSVYGLYLDSVSAYKWAKQRFEQTQLDGLRIFKAQSETFTLEDLDQKTMHFGKGDPNSSGARFLHRCTQGEYKARNAAGGKNHKIIGNLCVVLIYQYWDDTYRKLISDFLDISQNNLQVGVMGDLRQLRHSIIHNQSFAIDDITKCKIIKWFQPQDEIFFDEDQFELIILAVKKAIFDLYPETLKPA